MKRGFNAGRAAPKGASRGSVGALFGAGAAALVFALYVRTLAPTVLYYDPRGLYDAAMLQVQAYLLDIPNPTGYPLYVMLAKLFTYLPVGDVGYRVNLASAVFGAVAVFLLYAALRRLTGRIAPAVAGAILFGVSRTFWSQAVVAEVYTLNALFVCLVLLVLLVWREKRRDGYLLLAAFLMGLSLSHHMTSGLLIPASLLFVALVERRKLAEWGLVIKGIGLFCAGLLPYLYLPIRARMNPPLNESDPSTWENFWVLVSGSRFEERMFAYGPGALSERLDLYLEYLTVQFHPAFLVVAALGVLYLLARDRPALATFGLLYAGWLVYALEYNIKDVYLYFIPTYLVICLFVGAGLWALLDAAEAVAWRPSRTARTAVVAALSALMVLAPLYGVGGSYRAVDRSRDYTGRETIEAVAEGTEEGSTVLHNGGALWYLTLVEGRRTDLRLVDPFEPGDWTAKTRKWVAASEKHLKKGRVYVVFPGDTERFNEGSFEKVGYRLAGDPSGRFYEVVRREGES